MFTHKAKSKLYLVLEMFPSHIGFSYTVRAVLELLKGYSQE